MAALCRALSNILRLPEGAAWGRSAASSSRLLLSDTHQSATNVPVLPPCTLLHTSLPRNGLEEFFDDPQNWGKTEVKSGDSWTVEQLRGKSSEDLHKLWFVLLKERNMLLTLEQEAKRQRLPMPSPERLDKVTYCLDDCCSFKT
ncbi:39S ribosomal protein L47, mitochondrial [Varanus komodoensis]|uniref:39S ribosomal protein L47, mitochondrial n=1 Tax=Varanus komodoensis TaxID=61221 RepID=UPI001CF77832|nr:39S ribosomal protein L47, mitochondrial [Varanus komodoensis]